MPRRANSTGLSTALISRTRKGFGTTRAYAKAPARTVDEARFVAVGRIGMSHWTAIITYRDERVRLISVRRARDEEIERYESL